MNVSGVWGLGVNGDVFHRTGTDLNNQTVGLEWWPVEGTVSVLAVVLAVLVVVVVDDVLLVVVIVVDVVIIVVVVDVVYVVVVVDVVVVVVYVVVVVDVDVRHSCCRP